MKKKQEPKIIPMKCAVCNECYRYADRRPDKCHFGGPYLGYVWVEDKTKNLG